MKRIIIATLAFVSALFCVSCDKTEETGAAVASVFIGTNGNAQFNDIYQLTLDYEIKEPGGLRKSTNNAITEDVSFQGIACPCTISLTFKYRQAGEINENEEYTLEFGGKLAVYSYKDGTSVEDYITGETPVRVAGIKGSEIKSYFNNLNETAIPVIINVDADGKMSFAK